MKKIRLKALLITILSLSIIPSSYAKKMEDDIVKSKRVKIWETLVKRVVDNELFQKKCRGNGGKSQDECIKILNEETPLFDEETKRYVVQVIAQSGLVPLKDILKNLWNGFDIDLILGITVPAMGDENNQTLEEVLVQKAIILIGVEPKEEENEDMQEEVVVNDQIKIEVENEIEEEVVVIEVVVNPDKEEENASGNAPAKEDAKPIISNIETNDQPIVSSRMEKLKSYTTPYLFYGLLIMLFFMVLSLSFFLVRRKKKNKK